MYYNKAERAENARENKMRLREIRTSYHYINVSATDKFLNDPERVAKILSEIIPDSDVEYLVVFNLGIKMNIIGFHIASKGSSSQSVATAKDVFKTAILEGANAVIIAHNHPSEILEPSLEDISVTKKLNSAAEIIGIDLLDHVIVNTRTGEYKSLKQEGLF